MSAPSDMLELLREAIANPRARPRFTVKRLGEWLAVHGWTVTVQTREESGAGIMSGRVFLRSPGSYRFTYLRAVRADGKTIERHSRSVTLYGLAYKVLTAIGRL